VPLLHRDASLLALAFIGVHIASVVLDGYAPIGWADTVAPFLSQYRPVWLGLGAVGFDVVVAVTITSLLRRHLRFGAWRAVHWMAYASWATALVHGLGTGSDTKVPWMLGVEALCVALVIAAALWRLQPSFAHLPSIRGWGRAVTLAAPIVLIVWVTRGPLHPGWARQAGTPASLLVNGAAASAGVSATGDSDFTPPFRAALSGTIVRPDSATPGSSTVEIDTTLSDGASGDLRITLRGPTQPDGSLQIQSSTVELSGASTQTPYQGQVNGVAGNTLTAAVVGPDGSPLDLTIRLNVTEEGDGVRGTVQGSTSTREGSE
jgi:sulfoxide reductase heme-binding subunit YedZ